MYRYISGGCSSQGALSPRENGPWAYTWEAGREGPMRLLNQASRCGWARNKNVLDFKKPGSPNDRGKAGTYRSRLGDSTRQMPHEESCEKG